MNTKGKPGQSTLQQLAPFMGMGIQLAAAMTAFGAIGWWLDGRFNTTPWLLVAGVLLGAVGGMIGIVRSAIRSNPSRDASSGESKSVSGSGAGSEGEQH